MRTKTVDEKAVQNVPKSSGFSSDFREFDCAKPCGFPAEKRRISSGWAAEIRWKNPLN
jgi:ribosomal protein L37E